MGFWRFRGRATIPLATMTTERVRNLYNPMDRAYDMEGIRAHGESLDASLGSFAIGSIEKLYRVLIVPTWSLCE